MTKSEAMSRIKSSGNKSTELATAKLLRGLGITGWRRQVKIRGIRVDFYFRKQKACLFVDGCFWHWCILHSGFSKLNHDWRTKLITNYVRDITQNKILKRAGYSVWRLWEHDLRKSESATAVATLCRLATTRHTAQAVGK